MTSLACVLLVDRRGWVLLQERDGDAPRAANQWGMPGGHVEENEHPDAAARRELEEETGIRLAPDRLALWREEQFRYSDAPGPFHYRVYAAAVDLDDTDIVVGEGRQIVFVAPARVAALDLSESARHFVGDFLESDLYRRLAL